MYDFAFMEGVFYYIGTMLFDMYAVKVTDMAVLTRLLYTV